MTPNWHIFAHDRAIDLRAPHFGEADLVDHLASNIAHQTRWTGMITGYSVAAHCVAVARLAARRHPFEPLMPAFALLHDVHEAIIGDVPRPVEDIMGHDDHLEFRRLRARLDAAIHAAAGLPRGPNEVERQALHALDMTVLAHEIIHFGVAPPPGGWAAYIPVATPGTHDPPPRLFGLRALDCWQRGYDLYVRPLRDGAPAPPPPGARPPALVEQFGADIRPAPALAPDEARLPRRK